MGNSGGRENGFVIVLAGLAIGAVVGTIAFGPVGFFAGAVVGLFVGLCLA